MCACTHVHVSTHTHTHIHTQQHDLNHRCMLSALRKHQAQASRPPLTLSLGRLSVPRAANSSSKFKPRLPGRLRRGSLWPRAGQEKDHRGALRFDRRPGQTAALGAASGGSFPSAASLWFLVSLGPCSLLSRISSSPRTLSPQRSPAGRPAAS